MKDKINENKIRKILKDYVVSWEVLTLIGIILFGSDFILSKPVYIILLDTGVVVGNLLAMGMATLFTVLPKVAAKLMAKKRFGLSIIAIICGLGLLSFIYVGQVEVARHNAANPLNTFMAADIDTEAESNIHIVATSLIALLYVIGTFLSYLFYSDQTKFGPMGFRLSMSKLGRVFQYRLLRLKGHYERALAKPKTIAEAKVYGQIQSLERRERELVSKLCKQESDRNYELAVLDNARKRIEAAIRTAYKN